MIDIEKCKKAMENITVKGLPDTSMRKKLIEEAIQKIQDNPDKCFSGCYLGIKNYAGFGDQREDHEYGMGPRHGSIVFYIGRTDKARCSHHVLGEDEVYFLECVRDFDGVENPEYVKNNYSGPYQPEFINLPEAIQRMEKYKKYYTQIENSITETEVTTHS
jgi:hypothetical protein